MTDIPAWVILDSFSLVVIFLLLVAYRIRIAARTKQKSYVVLMLIYLGALFISHVIGQLATPTNVLPGIIGNVCALSLDVGILVFWQAYCEIWASMDDGGIQHKGASRWLWAQRIFLAVNIILNIVGFYWGWFFFYDKTGVYHRGPLFMPHVAATVLSALFIETYLFLHHKTIPSQAVPWLAIFPLAPFIGGMLQIALQGLPLEFAGALFSVNLLHVFVQERDANTDFLTGIANRRQLDIALETRMSQTREHTTFAGILADIDHFKQINDTYGHNQGDAALVEVAALLVRSITADDFVARYGGDEFFVLTKIDHTVDLEAIKHRIHKELAKLNRAERLGFDLDISLGLALFNPETDHEPADFIHRLDRLLYEEKRHKAAALGLEETDLR